MSLSLNIPASGAREGSPGEASFLAAGDEFLEALPRNLPVYVVSESLGTGVAAHLAQKYPSIVVGLALFGPFDRLASMAENHVPFLPAYFLLVDRYDPVDWLKDYHGPVEVIVAGSDEIIPSALGRHLYDEYASPKMLQVVPGAHHSDTTDESADWWKDVLVFWQQHPVASKPTARPMASVTLG
jgi:pimeloyl-ACP methyl ester carboxylesterase